MHVKVNGESRQLTDATSVADLLRQLDYQNDYVAVAINRTCILRSQFAMTTIKSDDEVEILAPMAGG